MFKLFGHGKHQPFIKIELYHELLHLLHSLTINGSWPVLLHPLHPPISSLPKFLKQIQNILLLYFIILFHLWIFTHEYSSMYLRKIRTHLKIWSWYHYHFLKLFNINSLSNVQSIFKKIFKKIILPLDILSTLWLSFPP